MKEKLRMPELDLMRGLAVIFMIAVHSQMIYSYRHVGKELWGRIIYFLGEAPSAPTFLYLMGFLVGVKPRGPFAAIAKRAGMILLAGYALNFLRLSLPLWLGVPLKGDPWDALWMIDILQLAAPMMIFLWWVKPWPKWGLALLVAGITLLAPLVWGLTSSPHPLDFVWGKGYLVFFPFFPWAVFPIFGLLCSQITAKQRVVASYLLIAAGISSIFLFTFDREFFTYYHTFPGRVIWMLGFCGLWHSLAAIVVNRLPALVMRGMKFFSVNVTSAYFFSWMFINWGVLVFGFRQQGALVTLGIMLLVSALTALAILGWKRVKFFGQTRSLSSGLRP